MPLDPASSSKPDTSSIYRLGSAVSYEAGMTISVKVKCKGGNSVIIPNIGLVQVPQVGQTINVPIGDEVVTVQVTGVRRHYPGGDIDNPLHAIEGEEV